MVTVLKKVFVFWREVRRVLLLDNTRGRRKVFFNFGRSDKVWRWRDVPCQQECFVMSWRDFIVFFFRCIFSLKFSWHKLFQISLLSFWRGQLWHRILYQWLKACWSCREWVVESYRSFLLWLQIYDRMHLIYDEIN